MIKKAIKIPIEIKYMTFEELWTIKQVFDNKADNVPNIDYTSIKIYHEHQRCLHIKTLNGYVKMLENDYLIIGVKGELYPCRIDIFKETYKPIKEETK